MTPSALLVTGLAGLALGAGILLGIGRAGFRRRNFHGLLVVRSYGDWLLCRGAVLLLAALNAPPKGWKVVTRG